MKLVTIDVLKLSGTAVPDSGGPPVLLFWACEEGSVIYADSGILPDSVISILLGFEEDTEVINTGE